MPVAVHSPTVMRARTLLDAVPTMDDHSPGVAAPLLTVAALLVGATALFWAVEHPTVAVALAAVALGSLVGRRGVSTARQDSHANFHTVGRSSSRAARTACTDGGTEC